MRPRVYLALLERKKKKKKVQINDLIWNIKNHFINKMIGFTYLDRMNKTLLADSLLRIFQLQEESRLC